MSHRQSTLLFLMAFGLVLAACSPGAGGITAIPVTLPIPTETPPDLTATPTPVPTPGEDTVIIGTAAVEQIDILLLESFPVQVQVVALGNLPDGCTRIGEITQEQVGNEFRVNIATVRPEHALCPQALVPFEQTVALEVVGLPAGTYEVNVNGVTGSFELTADNVPDY